MYIESGFKWNFNRSGIHMSYAINAWLNGYKKIFCYSGRERRRDFGFFLLIQLIVFFVIAFIASRLFGGSGVVAEIVAYGFVLVSILTMLPYNVRRLHDAGQSGWWCLGWLVFAAAFIGAALVMKPTVGDNAYGSDPRAGL